MENRINPTPSPSNYTYYRLQCRAIIVELNEKSQSSFSVYRYYDEFPWSPTHFMHNKIVFQVDDETVAMCKTWKEMADYLINYIKSIEKHGISIEWFNDGN